MYDFNYKYLEISDKEVDSKPKGVLGKLKGYGTLFNVINGNTRTYTKDFWTSVLNGDRIQRRLKDKDLYSALNHPSQKMYEEGSDPRFVEFSDAAAAISGWEIDDKGVLVSWDILDTPPGRVLNALARYGSAVGVSTRAYGKQKKNADGSFSPDPDDYYFANWDFVPNPAFLKTRAVLQDSQNGFYDSLKLLDSENEKELLLSFYEDQKIEDQKIEDQKIEDQKIEDQKIENKKFVEGLAEISNLQKENKSLLGENQKLKDSISSDKVIPEEFSLKIKALEDSYKERLSSKELEIEGYKDQIKELQDQVDSLEIDKITLQESLDFSKNSLEKSRIEICNNSFSLEKENKELLKQVDSLERTNKDLEVKLSNLYTENKEKSEQLDSYKRQKQLVMKKSKPEQYSVIEPQIVDSCSDSNNTKMISSILNNIKRG